MNTIDVHTRRLPRASAESNRSRSFRRSSPVAKFTLVFECCGKATHANVSALLCTIR